MRKHWPVGLPQRHDSQVNTGIQNVYRSGHIPTIRYKFKLDYVQGQSPFNKSNNWTFYRVKHDLFQFLFNGTSTLEYHFVLSSWERERDREIERERGIEELVNEEEKNGEEWGETTVSIMLKIYIWLLLARKESSRADNGPI